MINKTIIKTQGSDVTFKVFPLLKTDKINDDVGTYRCCYEL